jgi:preprotein translocase subunit SecA
MDYLREGINLRAMGQKDPLTEWQREGYSMFEQMMKGVATDFVRYAMQVHVNVVRPEGEAAATAVPDGTGTAAASPVANDEEPAVTGLSYSAPDESLSGGGLAAAAAAAPVDDRELPAQVAPSQPQANTPVVKSEWDKTPRNAPCPCGSGKKFKMCHGA